MVYPVLWTAVCYVTVITLFIKKVGVVRPNFGGQTPLRPPSGSALGHGILYRLQVQNGHRKCLPVV